VRAQPPPAHLSVHDVEPESLGRVERLVEVARTRNDGPVTLLVIAGRPWSDDEIRRLRRLVDDGCELAGHGVEHRAPSPATLAHRIHARVISRDQAEHLSRPRADLVERVERTWAWFREAGLPRPELYVPPAWALGRLTGADLKRLPYRWYETLGGFLDARTGRRRLLPLVGFEADTPGRRRALRLTNRANLALARRLGRPCRISLHPEDLELLLAADVHALLERPWRLLGTADAIAWRR
jgi:predicted deacetylase